MTTYNFKRHTTLYLVYGGLQYKLSVYPDLSFSQTFEEQAVPVKTLHDQSLNFDSATITKANPANFSFAIPLIDEEDLQIVFDLLIGYDSSYNVLPFDLYAKTDYDVYKLQTCVIDTGTFYIQREGILALGISGSASKLTRYGDASSFTDSTIGTAQTRSATTTYIPNLAMKVTVNSVEFDRVTGVQLVLKNNVNWTANETIHDALAVTSASNTIYPTSFTLDGRTLSGSIDQYVTDESYSNLQTWSSSGVPITIQVGKRYPYTLDVSIPLAVFTNRLSTSDLYTQTFDFRMLSNPTALSSVLVYN